jgi:hypothetical protein
VLIKLKKKQIKNMYTKVLERTGNIFIYSHLSYTESQSLLRENRNVYGFGEEEKKERGPGL